MSQHRQRDIDGGVECREAESDQPLVAQPYINQALHGGLTRHLQIGKSELEAAKPSLKAANSTHDEKLIAQTNVHFTTAKLQFMVARQMADSSQLLQRLESLPTVGSLAQSRHTAVDGIADMGVAISDAGLELAKLDGHLIPPPTAVAHQGRTLLPT